MKRSELLKLLRKNGCRFYEEGSNHEKWLNPSGRQFTVPRHSGKEIPKGLAEGILKQAGIKK